MRKKLRAEDLIPVGLTLKVEAAGIGGCLVLAAFWSLRALAVIREKWSDAADGFSHGQEAAVPAFGTLLGPALYGFYAVAAGMLLLAAWHYAYHRRGARADYLMDRLPNRWEKHLRCLAVPVLGALASLLTAGVLGLLYRLYYIHWRNVALEARAYWEGLREAMAYWEGLR